MKYIVIMDSDYGQFAIKVNAKLADGWIPQGGVSVRTNENGASVYYQALTK
jgi:hypothetical protein